MIATRIFISTALSSSAVQAADAAVLGGNARGDSTFTVQGIVLIVGLIATAVTLLMNQRKVRRENEADGKAAKNEILGEVRENRKTEDERFREVEERMRAAETRMERFVPGDVIDGKIEHLKTNRIQSETALLTEQKRLGECVVEQGKQIAKMEERHAGMAASVQRIEALVAEQGKDMRVGFEKLQDALHGRSAA